MDVAGRPLFAYLVDRIKNAVTLDAIVVATTTDKRDDVIIDECWERGIDAFRGSESDVLGRYVSAAQAFGAEIIVRVTADNPFTDPRSIDRVVGAVAGGADYAIENGLPLGVTAEAIKSSALSFIDSVATTPPWREHVTLYAKENPEMLRCAFLPAPDGCNRPDLSFTVDALDEYRYVREIALEFPSAQFELKKLIEFADAEGVGVGSLAI
jgi:spore coat polysaccharide biosynthesis protein SpsF